MSNDTEIAPETYDTIQVSVNEDGVARVVLDRPGKHNAISTAMLEDLGAAFQWFDALDRSADGIAIRVVVVEGAGEQAFSAGADVSEFGEHSYPHVDQTWWDTFQDIAAFGAPIVGRIDGYCLGGGLELALLFDFRIASERSTFGFPEIELGMFPTGGGTQRLPRLIGRAAAKELMMLGDQIGSDAAKAMGFVTAVHPTDAFDAAVSDFVDRLAARPPLALRAIKETVDKTPELGLQQGLEFERRTAIPIYHSEDYREGVAAWNADRDPQWTGR